MKLCVLPVGLICLAVIGTASAQSPAPSVTPKPAAESPIPSPTAAATASAPAGTTGASVRKEILDKYDKNHDGVLDADERAAFEKDREVRKAERLRKYDKNHDGKLDESERATMRADREKENAAIKAESVADALIEHLLTVRLPTIHAAALAGLLWVATLPAVGVTITDDEALTAGRKLWKNECDGMVEGLTSWNEGEDFASLGIGHYIWYPAGKRGPFEESFPDLVRFLAAEKVALPEWLRAAGSCPWGSRGEFLADRRGARLTELRVLLVRTVAWQARFSADRLEGALPKMLADAPPEERQKIRRQFDRVAASPNGMFALVDYVNFKGEGVLATERYQGRGWGLLQVLAGMDDRTISGTRPVHEFATSAARVLSERVANSPRERGEARWLPGWKNRVERYVTGN